MSRQHPPIELRSGTPVIPYGPGLPYATVESLPGVGEVVLSAATGVLNRCGKMSGVTWLTRTSAADNGWFSVVECQRGTWAGRLVAVANSGTGNRVMTSDDGGVTWLTRTSAADNSWISVVECQRGTWAGRLAAVAESGTGNRVMTSDPKNELWSL